MRCTRAALVAWRADPWTILRAWLLGALAVAGMLLGAVFAVAVISPAAPGLAAPGGPPFVVGGPRDIVHILLDNGLVLALHAMACVAGFIAGSSLPLQADHYRGRMRAIHRRGPSVAIAFVVCATAFSLGMQAFTIGHATAQDADALHISRTLLLVGVLPHALPELVALFLPLAAWILASRRGEWERLLAATFATVSLAVPTLIVSAIWEVYVAPRVLAAIIGSQRRHGRERGLCPVGQAVVGQTVHSPAFAAGGYGGVTWYGVRRIFHEPAGASPRPQCSAGVQSEPTSTRWHTWRGVSPIGGRWYPDDSEVDVDCARVAASYGVRFTDGATGTGATWLHIRGGKWFPTIVGRQETRHIFGRMPAC